MFPDQPQRVHDVLMKGVELPDAPALPAVVLDDIYLAELEPRSPPGFSRREPAGHMLLGAAFEMEAQLVVEVVFRGAAAEEGA